VTVGRQAIDREAIKETHCREIIYNFVNVASVAACFAVDICAASEQDLDYFCMLQCRKSM